MKDNNLLELVYVDSMIQLSELKNWELSVLIFLIYGLPIIFFLLLYYCR